MALTSAAHGEGRQQGRWHVAARRRSPSSCTCWWTDIARRHGRAMWRGGSNRRVLAEDLVPRPRGRGLPIPPIPAGLSALIRELVNTGSFLADELDTLLTTTQKSARTRARLRET